MKTMQISDAKKHFVETGRLNRNIIRDEIAISWYKCRLGSLPLNRDHFNCSVEKVNQVIEPQFYRYLDSIIQMNYDYILSDCNNNIIGKRMTNSHLMEFSKVDENCIGTNAATISNRTGNIEYVHYEEHYLNVFSSYCTLALPIKSEDKIMATIMLISQDPISQYTINELQKDLIAYQERKTIAKPVDGLEIKLSEFLIYPRNYETTLMASIHKLQLNHAMSIIIGSHGSGKTSMAWFLGMQSGEKLSYISCKDLPVVHAKKIVEGHLYENDTIILDDIEYLPEQVIVLLTIYNQEKYHTNKDSKLSNYKAKSIILTTDYSSKASKIYLKLVDQLKINCIELLNKYDFEASKDEIIKTYAKIWSKKIDYNTLNTLWKRQDCNSFKDLVHLINQVLYHDMNPIEKSELKPMTLEENEKIHIEKIYNYYEHNISLTADALGIGRSTLYRKLNKYQIETSQDVSK